MSRRFDSIDSLINTISKNQDSFDRSGPFRIVGNETTVREVVEGDGTIHRLFESSEVQILFDLKRSPTPGDPPKHESKPRKILSFVGWLVKWIRFVAFIVF